MTLLTKVTESGERRKSSLEISSLLRDILITGEEARDFEVKILDSIEELMSIRESEQLNRDERRFLRELIQKEKAANELRAVVKAKIIENTAWGAVVAVFLGLGLLLKDYVA